MVTAGSPQAGSMRMSTFMPLPPFTPNIAESGPFVHGFRTDGRPRGIAGAPMPA